MDKKYQVFVSSTYDDLKLERRAAMESLLNADCIPAGMELFPAADEEQFEFIKKVIDNCDYYLLIIGSRYGSLSKEGISFTEKEFDYAVSKNIKVIALIAKNPLPSKEMPDAKKKLEEFKVKITDGRLVKFWEDHKDIAIETTKAISHAKDAYPAIGWVRANKIASEALLSELNETRKEADQLKSKIKNMQPQKSLLTNLADMEEKFTVNGRVSRNNVKYNWQANYTWIKYFSFICPKLIEPTNNSTFKFALENRINEDEGQKGRRLDINESDFETIKIQFEALGLIRHDRLNTVKGGLLLFWSLTDKGHQLLMETRTVKKQKA